MKKVPQGKLGKRGLGSVLVNVSNLSWNAGRVYFGCKFSGYFRYGKQQARYRTYHAKEGVFHFTSQRLTYWY